MKALAFFIIFSLFFSCTDLSYRPDIGFLNSAQANSSEYLIKLNGATCKDMDGKVGACIKRVKSDQEIAFFIEKRPYAYRLELKCSSSIDSDLVVDIKENEDCSFKIPPEKFEYVKSFTCIGEIFPYDREQEVSATFHVRVLVVDKHYLGRELIYFDDNDLVLGTHAKYSNVDGKWYKEKAIKRIYKKPGKIYTESELMRMSYHGY